MAYGTCWIYMVVDSKTKGWNAVCRDPFVQKDYGRRHGQRYPCNWEVKATFKKRDISWSIKSWVDHHCCMADHNSREHANLTSTMIALCIQNQIENNVKFKPSAVVTYVSDKKVFHYVFWVFGPAIEAFQLTKPVLSVDGTHLRGRLKGKLLAGVGYDANKNCLPVAFAIVDEETNEGWNWFLNLVRVRFLNLVRVHIIKHDMEVCIISDMHQGIINSMDSNVWKEVPVVYHRTV